MFLFIFFFSSWLLWRKKKSPVSHVACFCVPLCEMSSYIVLLWSWRTGAGVAASHSDHRLLEQFVAINAAHNVNNIFEENKESQ